MQKRLKIRRQKKTRMQSENNATTGKHDSNATAEDTKQISGKTRKQKQNTSKTARLRSWKMDLVDKNTRLNLELKYGQNTCTKANTTQKLRNKLLLKSRKQTPCTTETLQTRTTTARGTNSKETKENYHEKNS